MNFNQCFALTKAHVPQGNTFQPTLQLTPSKEARLLREAQDHIRTTPAVQAIVADGNATSIRSRCSCLNQALEQGKDALLGTVSNPDVVFWHRLAL
eukprot:506772-Pelagomonas_calceolata.AAC.1